MKNFTEIGSKTLRFFVASKEKGIKLLAFLKEKCHHISSVKALKRAIEAKACKVNGKVERFSTSILQTGDEVEFNLEVLKAKRSVPKKITILHEDEDLLICDKPAGVISQNEPFQKAFPQFKTRLKLVHRLDKETSGIIVLAKNEEAKKKMEQLFEERKVYKAYLAIVDGIPGSLSGKIVNYMAKIGSFHGQSIWGVVKKKGLRAITGWKVLRRGKKTALVLCEPETGRTHQIRVHLLEMGHPILGDFQYCRDFACPYPAERQLLHAYRLSFDHPITQKKIDCLAPIPEDFHQAQEALNLTFS